MALSKWSLCLYEFQFSKYLQKYLSHPSLVIYFFFNLTQKTETGRGGGLLIANHLDQSICYRPIWNIEQQSDHICLLHSFMQVHNVLQPLLTGHCKLYNYAEPKPFCWAKPAHFDFSSFNFNVHEHIYWALLEMLLGIQQNQCYFLVAHMCHWPYKVTHPNTIQFQVGLTSEFLWNPWWEKH
jgi:hypothetical protein